MLKHIVSTGLLLSIFLTACTGINQPAGPGRPVVTFESIPSSSPTPSPLPQNPSSPIPNATATAPKETNARPLSTTSSTSPVPDAAANPDPIDAIPRGLPITWPEPDIKIGSISFISMQEGWSIINASLYQTKDGGQTWEEIAAPPVRFQSLDFVDQTHGWALGGDGLYATVDGGRQWQKQVEAPTRWGPVMDFTSPKDGWLAKRDELFHTQDGGATWQQVTMPQDPHQPQKGPTPLPTITLTPLAPNTVNDTFFPLTASISFISPETGWLLYQNCNGRICGSWFYRTQDGGGSWEKVSDIVPGMYSGHEIFFLDETHGWFVGTRGSYDITSDGGISWENGPGQVPGMQASLNQIKMFSLQNGIAVVRSTIVQTNDGGSTWQPVIPKEIRLAK